MADREGLSRREALGLAGLAACGLFGARPVLSRDKSRSRPIPATGELLPVVGLGTWRTFDVGASARQTGRLEEVLSLFARNPGGLIDGSPMYGRSEAVLGEMVARRRLRKSLFLADKVWTEGRQAGIEQMERSFRSLGVDRIDLMQVHNLVDVRTQLPTLLEWKAQGRVRYVGITHYLESADEEVERVLRSQSSTSFRSTIRCWKGRPGNGCFHLPPTGASP